MNRKQLQVRFLSGPAGVWVRARWAAVPRPSEGPSQAQPGPEGHVSDPVLASGFKRQADRWLIRHP